MPSVRCAGCHPCRRERSASTAPTHCSTPRALQPAAVETSMPCAAHHAVSMWSNPMVAVAIIRTREPSSRAAPHRVRVRTTRASASRTSAAEMSAPGRYRTSAKGSRTPRRKGMALSATIFMVLYFCFRGNKYSEKIKNLYLCSLKRTIWNVRHSIPTASAWTTEPISGCRSIPRRRNWCSSPRRGT